MGSGDVGVANEICDRIIGTNFIQIVVALVPQLKLIDLRYAQCRKKTVYSFHIPIKKISTLRVGVIERFHHFAQLRVGVEQGQAKGTAYRSLAPHLMKDEVDKRLHLFHLMRHVGIWEKHQPCTSPLPG